MATKRGGGTAYDVRWRETGSGGKAAGMTEGYSDRELGAMMADLESDLVERKESLRGDSPARIREAVCAFANDLPDHRRPGVVLHFDSSAVRTAAVGDLRVGRFMDEYLPAAVDAETLAANDRTAEERLAAAKMIVSVDEPVPTVAGVLVLGKQPQHFLPGAYVQFLRIAGREWGGEVLDEARCDGPVADLVSRVDDKLIAHNRTAVEFISSPTETRRSTYPLGALQQLVRNAVMHRAYDGTNAPVHVYWFDDRIEINSPGGPYGALTPENFGRPGVIDYRNPTLAEAMRVLGLVQRYGFGIPAARRELRAAGQSDPEFRIDAHWVHCTVRALP